MSLMIGIFNAMPGRARWARQAAALANAYIVRLSLAIGAPIGAAMLVQQALLWVPAWLGR